MSLATFAAAGELRLCADHPLLRGTTGAGVTVAVLDSGINPWHAHVGGLAGGVAISDDGTAHDDILDRLGHGTLVAAAIHEAAPAAEIQVVKIFDGTLSTTFAAMERAIRWCMARRIRLVNLSLGTANEQRRAALAGLAAEAATAGTLLVAPAWQGERPSFPGSSPGVVGVVADGGLDRDEVALTFEGELIQAKASGLARPIEGLPPRHGVSFAVANATGALARLLEARSGSEAATRLLVP